MKVEQMRGHVQSLAQQHQILVWANRVRRTADAFAVPDMEEVHIPPIRSAITYATALHEIGHLLGKHQRSHRSLVREEWAWRWARENALVWTPAMERFATNALAALNPPSATATSSGGR